MLYGVINRSDQFFFFDLNDIKSIHNYMVVLDKGPGFMDYDDTVKLYNTALHMISNVDFNKDIINLFKEIAKGLNLIELLKVDNKYINFTENLDTYGSKHDKFIEMWESSEDICTYDSYLYNIYPFTEMLSEDFQKIVSDESGEPILVEHGIHILYESGELSGCISKDIHDKIKNQLYYIPEHKTGDIEKDTTLSLSYILEKVSKVESNYSSSDNVTLLQMTACGLHFDHLVAINLLLKTFNYLLNSQSVKDNEMYVFDKLEVEKRIEHAKFIISRIPLLIKSRLN